MLGGVYDLAGMKNPPKGAGLSASIIQKSFRECY